MLTIQLNLIFFLINKLNKKNTILQKKEDE